MSTTNDSAYDTVADLHAAGIDIAAVVDARPELSDRAAEVAAETGARVLTGSAVSTPRARPAHRRHRSGPRRRGSTQR